jgi:hypothetical protein
MASADVSAAVGAAGGEIVADAGGAAGATLAVEVCWSPAPRVVQVRALHVAAGATVADAVAASGLLAGLTADEVDALGTSVWGRLQPPTHPLRDGDRIELTRGLLVDPKEARRQRYQQHKARMQAREAARPGARRPAPPAG